MQEKSFRVLLIEDNAADARLLKEHLSQSGFASFTLEWADRLSKGVERLSRGEIDVVLLDLMLPDSKGLDTFLKLRELAPGVPVIVMTGLQDDELALRAVREGAQDFFVKGQVSGSALARAMRYAIERQVQKQNPERKAGKVLGFMGAKGGVGTSTMVLNIASVLARQGSSVIAVELRPSSGSFCHQFRETPAANLGAILKLEPSAITDAELQTRLYKLPSGLRVLFGPQDPERFADILPDQASAIVKRLACEADYVLIDFPSQPSAATRAALRQCAFVTLVMEPEPVCMACAKTALGYMANWGIGSGVTGVILNSRTLLTNPIKLSDVKAALDCNIIGAVPPAPDLFAASSSSGIPVALSRADSNAGSVLIDLASRYASDPVEVNRF